MTEKLCKIIIALLAIEIVIHSFEVYLDLGQHGLWFMN